MAASIGKLEAELALNAGSYLQGMQSAAKRTGSFVSGAAKAAAGVAALGRQVAAYAKGALKDLIANQFAAIDSTAKLADRLGTTTEALTGLQHAAVLSGASNEAMNKSLETMLRNLGRAHDGSKSATAGFERLGLRVEDLARMDSAAVFQAIAEQISKLPTQAEKSAAAYEIFGRQGQALVNTLSAGSDGIQAMIADAKELGVTFDRDAAAKIEAANDALHRMAQASEGFKRQLSIALAPAVTKIADLLTEWNKMTPTWVARLEGAGEVISGLAISVENLVAALSSSPGEGGFFAFLEKHSSTIKALNLSLETLRAAAATEESRKLAGRQLSKDAQNFASRAELAGDSELAAALRSGDIEVTTGRLSNRRSIERRVLRAEEEAARRAGISVDPNNPDRGQALNKAGLPSLRAQEAEIAGRAKAAEDRAKAMRATLEAAKKAAEAAGLDPGRRSQFGSEQEGSEGGFERFNPTPKAAPQLAAVGTPGAVLKGTAEAFSAIRAPLRSMEERQLDEAKLSNEKADRRDRLLARGPVFASVSSLDN